MTHALRPALVGLPVLETERLPLRAPQAFDWPASHAIARRFGGQISPDLPPTGVDAGVDYVLARGGDA